MRSTSAIRGDNDPDTGGRDRYGFKPEDFPVVYDCFKRAVSLPIYSKMADEDVERVIQAVKDVMREGVNA